MTNKTFHLCLNCSEKYQGVAIRADPAQKVTTALCGDCGKSRPGYTYRISSGKAAAPPKPVKRRRRNEGANTL